MPRLIDADALQNLLLPIAMALEKEYGSLGGAISGVMRHIDNAPTIDPESLRPHGRWEKREDGYCGLALLECSLCRGECFDIDEDIELLNYRYCPNCGAIMDLEEEMTNDQD